MAWLYQHGRIHLPYDYTTWFNLVIKNTGVECFNINPDIAHLAVTLTEHHKDPQDRLIIATAIHYDCLLASMDTKFLLYNELQNRLIT